MEIQLAPLLGLYLFIIGALALYRRKSVMPAVSQMLKNRPLMLVVALVELLAGLAVVINYPYFTMDWIGLISIIGWMLLAESLLYLSLPYKRVQKIIKKFNKPEWYLYSGILAVVAGAYLTAVSFGWM
ncbi:hypothetical protein K8R03_04960 [Candidatus Kaiserbacteria bacterium]|nr:hypothetical protein [Candidatus Kaiserbacteria bacterium]